ncbi:MAG TPA: D-glycero-beta-D-manno-heptose 1-phosphate adenylyltransferase [Cytophagaceae bacterium]|jgi:rfaE bifunctional protein nucleotidyltransferase chain/domain
MKADEKIFTVTAILPFIEEWKKEGKVVFTNGCFDIVHLGHVDYLEQARNLGSRLIVGINADSSISKLKGSERPIVNEYARMRMLASFFFVDAVILFSEDTPYNLISALKPDILVKGDDYTIDKIVGADVVIENGGEVATIPLVKGYSTSNILNKIKNL